MSIFSAIKDLEALSAKAHKIQFPNILENLNIAQSIDTNALFKHAINKIDSMYSTSPKSALREEIIDDFISKLKAIAGSDNYGELSGIIEEIKTYANSVGIEELAPIIEELEIVQSKYQNSIGRSAQSEAIKNKYSNGLVAEIYQGNQYELGSSGGECFGFTMAMADPELTPYAKLRSNEPTTIKLTEKIHQYQRSQTGGDKKLPFKGAIVQRRKYCFGGNAQAHLILASGKEHPGKHLNISLDNNAQNELSGHSCYFRYHQDPQTGNLTIRYADPNGAAYEFDNERDFIEHYNNFFQDIYSHKISAGKKDFHFITIHSFQKTYESLELSAQEKRNAQLSHKVTGLDLHYTPPKGWGQSYKATAISYLHSFQSYLFYPIEKCKHTITASTSKHIINEQDNMANAFRTIRDRYSRLVSSRQQIHEPQAPTDEATTSFGRRL